jgi:hypothetical protein
MGAMRQRLERIGLGLWMVAVGVASAWAAEPAGDGLATMHVVLKAEACRTCHQNEKERPKLADVSRACDDACTRCHKDMDKHHPVGSEVQEKDKVPLPLHTHQRVGCISCHDVNAPATDDKSWKSQSLFGRLFQGQARYKTYFLRINNSSGKLCKTCH